MCDVNGLHYEQRNKCKTKKNSYSRLFPVTVSASLLTWFYIYRLWDTSCPKTRNIGAALKFSCIFVPTAWTKRV